MSLFPYNKENKNKKQRKHQKIAFVVPFVMLHSLNCAQLFIHPDLCGVYYELIHVFFRLYFFVLPFDGEMKMYISLYWRHGTKTYGGLGAKAPWLPRPYLTLV
jgi:hypothetical protein